MTQIINLYGGPGSGKSTTAAGLFFEMKVRGISCEMAREYAKDVVWEGRLHLLDQELYLFAKQLKRLIDLDHQVDYIITDSPLLSFIAYTRDSESLWYPEMVKETHNQFQNLDFWIAREKPYSQAGRTQTEVEAQRLDEWMMSVLVRNNKMNRKPSPIRVAGNAEAPLTVLNLLALESK